MAEAASDKDIEAIANIMQILNIKRSCTKKIEELKNELSTLEKEIRESDRRLRAIFNHDANQPKESDTLEGLRNIIMREITEHGDAEKTSPLIEFWKSILRNERFGDLTWESPWPKKTIYDAYRSYVIGIGDHPENDSSFWRQTKIILPAYKEARPGSRGKQKPCIILPSLQRCRAHFEHFITRQDD